MRKILLFAILCSATWSTSHAQDSAQQRVNAAIASAKEVCLVGSRYTFSMTAVGQLTVTKFQPGGNASTTVNAANATGGVLFEKEEIRQLVDENIRTCMAAEWPKVLKAIDGKTSSILSPLGFPSEFHDPRTIKASFVQGNWSETPPRSDHANIYMKTLQFYYDGIILGRTFRAFYLWPEGNMFRRIILKTSENWNERGSAEQRQSVNYICGGLFEFLLNHNINAFGPPHKIEPEITHTAASMQDLCRRTIGCQQDGGYRLRQYLFKSDNFLVKLSVSRRTHYVTGPTARSYEDCDLSVWIDKLSA